MLVNKKENNVDSTCSCGKPRLPNNPFCAECDPPEERGEVTFVNGNDRLDRMLAKPGMQEAVDARRADMRQADQK